MTVDDVALKLLPLLTSKTDLICDHSSVHYTCHSFDEIKRELSVRIKSDHLNKTVEYKGKSWSKIWDDVCEDLHNIESFLKDDYVRHLIR